MRTIPAIRYKKDAKRLAGFYRQAHSEVIRELMFHLENDSGDRYIQQEASLARQLQSILDDADERILPEVERMITESHHQGQARTLLALGDAKTLQEATKGITFSLFARESVNRMVEDTFEDVLSITNRTSNKIKKIVRDTSGEILRINAIQQIGYDTSRQQITERLLKEGFSKRINKDFKGITDSAGRRWRLDSYVNMLTHSKMSQAYMEGVRTESIERGTDLGLISTHGATDACSKYEGMVISLTGATDGYLNYDDLRASNEIFHPNCQHTVTPLRDIELLPAELQDIHYSKMSNLHI